MARELKPCGTSAAYRRHLRHGEPACQACLDAEAARSRSEGGAPFRPAQHGTASKYNKGCRCGDCTRAHSQRMAEWRRSVAGIARQVPQMVPHGLGGYRNYGCRCRVCTDAHSAACLAWKRSQRSPSP